jgi:hypothetical protein
MWKRLTDSDLISTYRAGFFDSPPEAIVELLDALSGEPFAGRVWAVTTHNNLRLTTAPSYKDETRHGAIWILTVKEGISVSYFRPSSLVASESMKCSETDALEVIRRFVHDFLFDRA